MNFTGLPIFLVGFTCNTCTIRTMHTHALVKEGQYKQNLLQVSEVKNNGTQCPAKRINECCTNYSSVLMLWHIWCIIIHTLYHAHTPLNPLLALYLPLHCATSTKILFDSAPGLTAFIIIISDHCPCCVLSCRNPVFAPLVLEGFHMWGEDFKENALFLLRVLFRHDGHD